MDSICHETECIRQGMTCTNCVFDQDDGEWESALKKMKPAKKKGEKDETEPA